EEVNEPGKPFRALIASSNINKLYFKVVKTSHLELRKIHRSDWGEKLYNKLNALSTVTTFTQEIIDDRDHQNHGQEIEIPKLPYGYYIILTSVNPDFKYSNNLTSYAQCIVS